VGRDPAAGPVVPERENLARGCRPSWFDKLTVWASSRACRRTKPARASTIADSGLTKAGSRLRRTGRRATLRQINRRPGEGAMRSYHLTEATKPLELVETDTPEPQGTEVLVRVTACG